MFQAKFADVSEAYNILSDPSKREEYLKEVFVELIVIMITSC